MLNFFKCFVNLLKLFFSFRTKMLYFILNCFQFSFEQILKTSTNKNTFLRHKIWMMKLQLSFMFNVNVEAKMGESKIINTKNVMGTRSFWIHELGVCTSVYSVENLWYADVNLAVKLEFYVRKPMNCRWKVFFLRQLCAMRPVLQLFFFVESKSPTVTDVFCSISGDLRIWSSWFPGSQVQIKL